MQVLVGHIVAGPQSWSSMGPDWRLGPLLHVMNTHVTWSHSYRVVSRTGCAIQRMNCHAGTQCCRCVEPHRIFRRSPFASVTYVRAAREDVQRDVTSLRHAALLCTTAAPCGSAFAVAARQRSAAVTRASYFSLGRNFQPFAASDRFLRLEYCNESPEVSFA